MIRKQNYILLILLIVQLACSFTQPPATPTPLPTTSPTHTPTVTPTSTRPATMVPSPTPTPTPEPVCVPTYFLPVAFLPNSPAIIGRREDSVVVFNLDNLQVDKSLEASKLIVQAALSPDGKTLAWALEDNTIQLVRMEDGEILHTLAGHTNRVDALQFSATGKLLASGGYDGWVRIWDMAGRRVAAFQPGGGEVLGLGLSPDEEQILTITFEGPPQLWNLAALKQGAQAPRASLGDSGAFSPASVQFAADGRRVGLAFGGGPAEVYQLPEGTLTWSGGDFTLALSPGEGGLAYTEPGPQGRTVIALASPDGAEVFKRLDAGTFLVWRLLFSPQGDWLLSADDLQLRLWDVARGQLVLELKASCP